MTAKAPPAFWSIVSAFVGAAIGFVIVGVNGLLDGPEHADEFVDLPQFLTWLAIVCLEVAGWAVASLYAVCAVRGLCTGVARRRWAGIVGRAILLVLLLGGGLLISRTVAVSYHDAPLPALKWRTGILTGLGAVVALTAVVGMWLVQIAVEKETCNPQKPSTKDLERFVMRGRQMRLLLGIVGAILGGAILGAGALRNLILAYGEVKKSALPEEYVIMYGAFLSALVALCYLPTQAAILAAGRGLRDRCLTDIPSHPAGPQWNEWLTRRKNLDEMLGVNVGVVAGLKAGAAILTPLGAGLVALLLPTSH